MININSTTLRFKEKHIICQQFYHTENKGMAQCNDNYPITPNISTNYAS